MAQGNASPGMVGYVVPGSVAIASILGPTTLTGVAPGTLNNVLKSDGTNWISGTSPFTGTVTSVSGTASRITSTGGTTPVIDIDAAYVGQTSLTTLGTITTGTWTGTKITVPNGGTGVGTFTSNGVLYGNSTGNVLVTAQGASNTVLLGNGGVPSFGSVPNAALSNSSVTLSNGTNISISGSPLSLGGTATVNVSGPITPTSYTSNGVLYGNSTSALQVTSAGNLGQTFVGAGTGGVPSFQNNLPILGPNPWCDVVAYGADPTGVADSRAAIVAAIAAIPVGGIVWFPTGTYKVSSTITITTPHVRFCGQSRTDSVINYTGGVATDCFVCNQWYQGFENLTFTCAANTKTAGYAINMADTYDYNYVWRCDFTNHWGGVLMAGHLCYIDDVQFRTFSNAAANGNWILLTASHDRWISKVVGDNGTNLAGFAGVRVVQTASLLMRDCSLIHGTNAMSIEPTVGLTVPSIEVINTFFDTSTNGLSVTGAGTPARSKFTNCWFCSHTADGVIFNNANTQGFTFVNCDFYGNGANGINAAAVSEWGVFDSRIAGNTTTGIRTTASASNSFIIQGNTIGPSGVFGANGLGINIQAGTYGPYKIRDNVGLSGNTTPGITDSGSVTGFNQKEVADNLGALLTDGIAATTAASAAINTTQTIVAGGLNIAPIPANSLQVGSTIRATLQGTCTASVANASTFRVLLGTAGTTADAVMGSAAVTSAATGTTIGFKVEIVFTVRTIGAAGSIAGSAQISNTGITGISTNNSNVIPLTIVTAPNTTVANYLSISYVSAAATTTCTFQNGIIEIIK